MTTSNVELEIVKQLFSTLSNDDKKIVSKIYQTKGKIRAKFYPFKRAKKVSALQINSF